MRLCSDPWSLERGVEGMTWRVTWSAASRGLAAGALAGLWVAFADYGATWLWLPLPRDRLWLLLRLLASLVPVGALVGCVGALLGVAAWRGLRARWPSRVVWLWPLPFTLAALAPLTWLTRMLCSGGTMSRLAQRYPLELGLGLLLPCALYLTLVLAGSAGRRVLLASESHKLRAALALLVAAFLLGKLNQTLLPNLYDYLHALLAMAAWTAAALGLALAGFATRRFARLGVLSERVSAVAVTFLVLLVVSVANARTLDQNLNVRVAMFDARSPTSRALLIGVDPTCASSKSRARAPRAGFCSRCARRSAVCPPPRARTCCW